MKVFLPTPAKGSFGEFKHVLGSGLQLSHRLVAVDHLEAAEVVVIDALRLSPGEVERITVPAAALGTRVIAIDYGDDPGTLRHAGVAGIHRYFKRSTVIRAEGRSLALQEYPYPCEFLPYCVREDLRAVYDALAETGRDIDVSCFHPPGPAALPGQRKRGEVARAIAGALPARYTRHVGHVGAVGRAGRNSVDVRYVQAMARSRIVVNCQPDGWEGDYRTFEALTCGALVFCDRMLRPPDGLVDGEHLVFYDAVPDLLEKLVHFLGDEDARAAIALNGFREARARHQAHHRMELACRA